MEKKKNIFQEIAEEAKILEREGKDKWGKKEKQTNFRESILRHGFSGPEKMKPKWTTSDGEEV